MFRSFLHRFAALTLAAGLFTSTASAADLLLCVVDAEDAINQTAEGKAAQDQLEKMYAAKQADLEKLQKDLERQFKDYEGRRMILSDQAKQETERELMEKQQRFQAMVYQSEQDMQQTYMQLLGKMEEKLLKAAERLGQKKGCSVVLQKAAVIFAGPIVTDLTAELVSEYDGN